MLDKLITYSLMAVITGCSVVLASVTVLTVVVSLVRGF